MAQYIDKDVLVAEIERRKQKLLDHIICESDKEWAVRTSHQMNKIIYFINTLEVKDVDKEPVSEDLEEAAMKYAKLKHKDAVLQKIVSWDFKAGAQWQKEQLKANTVDATICLPYENKDGGYTQLIDVSRPLPVGNNKIAIIFKENQ